MTGTEAKNICRKVHRKLGNLEGVGGHGCSHVILDSQQEGLEEWGGMWMAAEAGQAGATGVTALQRPLQHPLQDLWKPGRRLFSHHRPALRASAARGSSNLCCQPALEPALSGHAPSQCDQYEGGSQGQASEALSGSQEVTRNQQEIWHLA